MYIKYSHSLEVYTFLFFQHCKIIADLIWLLWQIVWFFYFYFYFIFPSKITHKSTLLIFAERASESSHFKTCHCIQDIYGHTAGRNSYWRILHIFNDSNYAECKEILSYIHHICMCSYHEWLNKKSWSLFSPLFHNVTNSINKSPQLQIFHSYTLTLGWRTCPITCILHECTKLHFTVEFTDKILSLNDSCALLKGWGSCPLINFSAVTRVPSSWIIKGLHWSYSSLRHEPHLTFDTGISLSVEHTTATCVSQTCTPHSGVTFKLVLIIDT